MTETADEQIARIKQGAMRDHPFVGDGPYCETWLSGDTLATENGSWSFRSGCGYPADMHPEEG